MIGADKNVMDEEVEEVAIALLKYVPGPWGYVPIGWCCGCCRSEVECMRVSPRCAPFALETPAGTKAPAIGICCICCHCCCGCGCCSENGIVGWKDEIPTILSNDRGGNKAPAEATAAALSLGRVKPGSTPKHSVNEGGSREIGRFPSDDNDVGRELGDRRLRG